MTDWRHYDTIYTERYMWMPQENKEGYDEGSAMEYAKDLKGRLMIYYGTADDNVHPNNAMQLIRALQQAGKSFEVQVGPDAGHSGDQPAADDGVLHRSAGARPFHRETVGIRRPVRYRSPVGQASLPVQNENRFEAGRDACPTSEWKADP